MWHLMVLLIGTHPHFSATGENFATHDDCMRVALQSTQTSMCQPGLVVVIS